MAVTVVALSVPRMCSVDLIKLMGYAGKPTRHTHTNFSFFEIIFVSSLAGNFNYLQAVLFWRSSSFVLFFPLFVFVSLVRKALCEL